MNFKKYHESKNLFDGAYTKGFIGTSYIYKNTNTSANCTIIPCEPSTTYSVKKHDDSNRFAIGTSNVMPYDEIQLTGVYYVDTATEYTFTTDSSAHYMVVYVSTGTEQAEPRLMVNTGSQPLPYEPYSSEVWHDIPHYIHNTSTDTITTLPAVLYPNDTTATVGLKGNMSQTGTPTPQNPIEPSECGERTENLFDKTTITTGKWRTTSGETTVGSGAYSAYIAVEADVDYYVTNIISLPSFNSAVAYDSSKTAIEYLNLPRNSTSGVLHTPNNCAYIIINFTATKADEIMLNTGSTVKPHEPYGYKIPISSANTTTPVYLGEVESTRKIYKIVLTGQESWAEYGTGTGHFYYMALSPFAMMNIYPVCTHYSTVRVASEGKQLRIYETYESTTAFTTYLQQQYAAGTPVTVWYVLATPQTAVVNEPIRKIGTYADEVSGITIPTIAGANSFDVLTTLKPSEVTVNYKGWHPVSAVHERESGQWD